MFYRDFPGKSSLFRRVSAINAARSFCKICFAPVKNRAGCAGFPILHNLLLTARPVLYYIGQVETTCAAKTISSGPSKCISPDETVRRARTALVRHRRGSRKELSGKGTDPGRNSGKLLRSTEEAIPKGRIFQVHQQSAPVSGALCLFIRQPAPHFRSEGTVRQGSSL